MATIYRLPGDTDDFVTVGEEGEKVPDKIRRPGNDNPTVVGGKTPLIRRGDGTLGPIEGEQLDVYTRELLSGILEELKITNHHLSLISESDIELGES